MIARVLLYNDLFEGEIPDISKLLSEISSRIVIEILSYINAELYIENTLEKQTKIFDCLVSRIDEKEKQQIIEKYTLLSNKRKNLIAFPIYSNLKLIEKELLEYRSIEMSETTGIDELNILKAIIVSNGIYEEDKLSKSKIKPKPDFVQLLWIIGFEQIEHSRNGLHGLMASIYYADKLFEYLKANNIDYYNIFLKMYGLNNHLEYLKNYLELIQNGIKQDEINSCFFINLIEENPFLKNFCIDINAFDSKEYKVSGKTIDFIGLREKPIIKHNCKEYSITNWNFILNKFVLGLMFDYYHSIYPERENKAFLKFKDNIGENFVEKTLLNDLLSNIFRRESASIDFLSENKSKGYNFDFYIRIENKVFLIECKDYLMPVSAKTGSIDQTEAYITDRMGGAVVQLHKQITKLNNAEYNTIEIPYDSNCLFIYPIIVYTDKSFSMPGVKYYLNNKLKTLLSETKPQFFRIWDLEIIHIDFFIKFQSVLKKNPKIFISLLNDSYHIQQTNILQMNRTGDSNYAIKSVSNFEDQMNDKLNEIDDNYLNKYIANRLT